MSDIEKDFVELYGELGSGNDDTGWYVIYTKPRREKKLAEYALQNKINYFLPLVDSVKYYGRKKVVYTKPMFTSYIFVRVNYEQKQRLCISGHTVSFIKVKDEETFLEELRYISQVRSHKVEVVPHQYLEIGTRVKFTEGPLKGVTGLVADSKNIRRVVLQVNILKRAISVTADSNQLEITGENEPDY